MRPEKLTLKNIGPFCGSHLIDFNGLGTIFLVYGKTGAGKTTLFDALCYAFYGEVPGGRKGLVRQMRSHFAGEDAECAVTLEFRLGNRRYRINRVLPRSKITRKGTSSEIPEESTLEECSGDLWKNLSCTNKRDTDQKIVDLIGLSAEEFSRIVLLPQGQFADFLKQNSNERKEVLSKLFPVGHYTRVIELAQERAREAVQQVAAAETQLEEIRSNYAERSAGCDGGELLRRIEELRLSQSTLRNELGKARILQEQQRALTAKKSQALTLEKRLDELNEAAPAHKERGEALAAAARASPLLERYRHFRELRDRFTALNSDQRELNIQLDSSRAELKILENQSAEMQALGRLKEELLIQREQLALASGIAATMTAETAEITQLERDKKQQGAALGESERELALIVEKLATLEADLRELENRSVLRDQAQSRLLRARNMLEISSALKLKQGALSAHSGAFAETEQAAENLKRDREILRSDIAVLEELLQKQRDGGEAAHLAATLTDGQPCPVCGSTAHPAPALHPAPSDFSLPERLQAAKGNLERLEAKLQESAAHCAARKADIAQCEAAIAELRGRARDSAPVGIAGGSIAAGGTVNRGDNDTGASAAASDIPSPAEAEKQLQTAVEAINAAEQLLRLSRDALSASRDLNQKTAALRSAVSDGREQLARTEQNLAVLKASIKEKKQRYLQALGKNAPEETDPEEALEKCKGKILQAEADLHSWSEKSSAARSRLAVLEGKQSGLVEALESTDTQLQQETEQLNAACQRAGFEGPQLLEKALLDDAQRTALENAVQSYEAEIAGHKARLAGLQAELAAWSGPEEAEVTATIATLEDRMESENRLLEKLSGDLATLQATRAQLEQLEARRADLSASKNTLVALAKDLTGKNPLNRGFDAWILGMYLEEITDYANKRLERISDGRYRLQLNESYRKGNSLSGLELEIFDGYTGLTRPTGTLSGGETFMASISLALGLADSILARSGGLQLDAVFIDEGFGSLDEASLERAIGILDEIRGQRMVALISHVSELKNRIPNRIEVIKTGSGSRIRKESGNV